MNRPPLWLWPVGLLTLWLLTLPLAAVVYGNADPTVFERGFQDRVKSLGAPGILAMWAILVALVSLATHWASFLKDRTKRSLFGRILLALPWSALLGLWWYGVNSSGFEEWDEWTIVVLLTLAPFVVIFGSERLIGSTVLKMGQRRYESRELSQAAWLLRIARRFKPADPSITKRIGMAHFRLREWKEAEEELHRAREAHPRDLETCRPLAKLALRRKAWKEAIPLLREHIERDMGDEEALMELTDAYLALGDMDNAIWAYEQIEHGKDLDRINRLLDLHMQKRDWTRALELAKRIREIETPPHRRFLEVVNRVLREEPDLPAAFNAMLNHLEEVGPAGELHRWRERLLAKQPQNIALRRKVIEHLREADDPVAYDRHLSAILEGPDSTVDDMIEMIESLTQRQDWEALDQWLTRAKEAHPDTWEFVLAEAQLALVRGRHDECFRLCHMARARARTEAQIKSVEELLVRLERARSENALDSLREAIAESADPMPLRWELVQRLISAKAFDQATNELDEILRRDPRQSERVHQTLGDLLEKNPKSFALLTFSRDLNAREGRHDEVLAITKRMAEQSLTPDVVMRECCERILNANPEHVDSLRWLAEDALRSENWEEGVALLDRWFRCDPAAGDDPVNLWRLFSGHCAQENVERAEKVAQRLIDAKHRELDTLRDLSRLYERHGQLVQAHQCALRARNLAPDDLNVRDAVKRLDAGIRADRVQELEQLIAAKPNDTVLHHELGDLLYSFERYTEAIPHLQRAAGDPARANLCRAKIAHSLGQRGMLDLAHESLQDVTIEADNPDDLETLKAIHYNLAEIFREEDHIERAREIFKRLFRVDAGYRNVVQKLEKLTH